MRTEHIDTGIPHAVAHIWVATEVESLQQYATIEWDVVQVDLAVDIFEVDTRLDGGLGFGNIKDSAVLYCGHRGVSDVEWGVIWFLPPTVHPISTPKNLDVRSGTSCMFHLRHDCSVVALKLR